MAICNDVAMELNPSWNLFGLKASMLTFVLAAFGFSQQPAVEATIQRQFWMKCQRHPSPIEDANSLLAERGDGLAIDALCIESWSPYEHARKALILQFRSVWSDWKRAAVEPIRMVAVFADSVTSGRGDMNLD